MLLVPAVVLLVVFMAVDTVSSDLCLIFSILLHVAVVLLRSCIWGCNE
jgi:hypothetical protein